MNTPSSYKYSHHKIFTGGVCVKGFIDTTDRCPCGGALKHSQNDKGFRCRTCGSILIPKNMRVRFPGNIQRRFTDHKYAEARQFLGGLRYKYAAPDEKLDPRDYRRHNPMGYANQVDKYLKVKKRSIKPRSYANIKRYLTRAPWGQMNVKAIGFAEIEDYLYSMDVSDKTRSNAKSALLTFFTWLNKREDIPVPKMPVIDFELGMRTIVSIDVQQKIIQKVYDLTWNLNPKIYIGIKWLATYIAFRPNELRMLKEKDIDVSSFFVVPKPKEKTPKLIAMLQEDIDLYHSLPRGLPDLYFFRHIKGNGSVTPGGQFGKDYLYKWWKKACSELGVEGVDLYGGTRHSTATALSVTFSESEIMKAATMHKSNKAARRYIQAEHDNSLQIFSEIRKMQNGGIVEFKKGNVN